MVQLTESRFAAYEQRIADAGIDKILAKRGKEGFAIKPARQAPWVLVAHTNPHMDEYLPMWMFHRFSSLKFDLSKTEFWGSGTVTVDHRPWQDHVSERKILLGCGGNSPFNEHTIDGAKTEGGSCTMLVAKFLGLENFGPLKQLIRVVHEEDTKGVNKSPLALPTMVKARHRRGRDQLETMQMVFDLLDDLYLEQLEFHREKLKVKKKITPVQTKTVQMRAGQRTIPVRIAVVHSDSGKISPILLNRKHSNHHASVVIQQRSTGHVMIFTNGAYFQAKKASKRLTQVMHKLITALRFHEAEEQGIDIPEDMIGLDGGLSCLPEWFYYEPMNLILNGSESAVDVEPTMLELQQIVNDVVWAFTN